MIHEKIRLFGKSTVARPDPGAPSRWLLMNRPDRGYGERGRGPYALTEIESLYAVRLGATGEDEHGLFLRVECL